MPVKMETLKKYIVFLVILLFLINFLHTTKGATTIYKFYPQNNKYEQDLVAVSSTVIPLKTIEIDTGSGHLNQTSSASKLHKKLELAAENKANSTISNMYAPNTLITRKYKQNRLIFNV